MMCLGRGLSASLSSALPCVGCICRQSLFLGGHNSSSHGCSRLTGHQLSQLKAKCLLFHRTDFRWRWVDRVPIPSTCSQGPGKLSSAGLVQASTPGHGVSSPDHHGPRGGDTPGKISVYSPEDGEMGPGWAQSSANTAPSTVHPPNPTRTCFEPGVKPRNESGTFLPVGRRGR